MQTWSGWRYKSENKARRCVVTVVIVIVVNAATSKMNHQMQPDLSTMVTMTIRMVVAGVCCGCGPAR